MQLFLHNWEIWQLDVKMRFSIVIFYRQDFAIMLILIVSISSTMLLNR